MTTDSVTLTIDGNSVTVPKGTKVIDAAREAGKNIPHFCYHPGLPVDGNCRMCISDIRTWNPRAEKHMPAHRPAVACWVDAEENMQVFTDTPEVKKARASVMEFLLINHPIDCPICDKAGECMLQDYYMLHDRAPSKLREEKVHKPRLVPFGKRIVYNGERCILCSRCTRFTTHVTKTHELGIVNRGDRAIVEVLEGGDFANAYTDNVADICPVGALTKTDFRFKKRVWFLKHTDSVCGGCSRNCNTVVDHDGSEVIRIMPRERAGVNDWWMCNEGRDLYKEHAALARPAATLRIDGLEGGTASSITTWVGEKLAEYKKSDAAAVLVSPWISNEEAWLLSFLLGKLKIGHLDVMTGRTEGALPADDLLHTDDPNPNRAGAIAAGIVPDKKAGKGIDEIKAAIEAGEIEFLLLWGPHFGNDLDPELLSKVATVVQITDEHDAVSDAAAAVLPLRTWAERDGTWTNFEGHTSRFRRSLRPPAGALDGFDLLMQLCAAAGVKSPAKSLRDARKKLKQDPDSDVRAIVDGKFTFPEQSALYRHTSGAREV